MLILGINAYHPDSSACILKDGKLIAAVEEERFLRIKHWAGFPFESIKYCLNSAEAGLQDIDHIAVSRDPMAKAVNKALFVLKNRINWHLLNSRLNNLLKINKIGDELSSKFKLPKRRLKARFHYIEHHRSHLASTYLVSPFNDSAIVSVDGFGDFSSCMAATGQGNKIKVIYSIDYPHSLGIFYTAITQFLGFNKFGDEYKIMGLSAYGQPKYMNQLGKILLIKPSGSFKLNLDYFSFYKSGTAMLWDNTEPKLGLLYSEKMIEEFGSARNPDGQITPFYCDIACSLQKAYENVFFHILNYVYEVSKNPRLCLAGGCALNSLANGKIFENTPFKEVYIQPASSDAGGALGAAYYVYNNLLNEERNFIMDNAYWGPIFSDGQLSEEIKKYSNQLESLNCLVTRHQDDLFSVTASLIAEGKVVGWFQGRMEWGPRALGNRSILADPRRQEIKDILNARIKRREWFRPFAPAILEEKIPEFFDVDYPEPFMLKVYNVKEEKKGLIPAVTHVDGTARLQSVNEKQNPYFWKLIKAFYEKTSIPVLLNTSFNENEPIVCTPAEALDCFIRTKMDALVLGNYIINKP
ncbi:MAG: carbamoyltransferase [Candidatus Omnitrophota bacterium]|jgi:carbamoyltransferase|nr:MAG: carbamoyltransferase [Candidatus Omnitrophota bacterium]